MRSTTLLEADDARPLVAAAVRGATELGVPMSFAVVDASGHPVLVERMTGANFLTPDVARAKAFSAVAWGMSSGALNERLSGAPYLVGAVAAQTGGRFMPQRGAVLVFHSGQIVGAIGASGGSAQQDEDVVSAAIRELGLSA